MSETSQIDVLTSLRFFAAAMVLTGHAGETLTFMQFHVVNWDYRQAVSFFFVLSGFILYWVDADRAGKQGGLKRFYVARIARIWPMHLLGLVLVLALLPAARVVGGALPAFSNVLLLHAWAPFYEYYYSYNDVSWSLSDEVFFYAVFPLLVPMVRFGRLIVLGAAIAVTGAINVAVTTLAGDHQLPSALTGMAMVYIFPLSRLAEFVLGMVTADLLQGRLAHRQPASWIRLACLEVAALVACLACMRLCAEARTIMPQELSGYWLATCGACGGFAMLIAAFAWSHLHGRGPLVRLLSFRPLVYLGEISFALYILHKIALRWLTEHPDWIAPNTSLTATPGPFILYCAAMIVVSALCYELWEKPARRYINRKLAPPSRQRRKSTWFEETGV